MSIASSKKKGRVKTCSISSLIIQFLEVVQCLCIYSVHQILVTQLVIPLQKVDSVFILKTDLLVDIWKLTNQIKERIAIGKLWDFFSGEGEKTFSGKEELTWKDS